MAAGVAAGTAAVRSRSTSILGPRLKDQQLEILQQVVTKHLEDPALREIATTEDFAMTTCERGISHWEHAHLVAALDTLNSYQRDRQAKSKMNVMGQRLAMRSTYKHDPRTRFVELLKRWLRNSASSTNVTEDEVRRMSGLCRDIMSHPLLFPARNERSFLKTIAEVYQHLDVQLREVLERNRTCADLAQRVLSLSRNLVSDAVGFLLVGLTDLKKSDELPSLEVVSMWASLPNAAHPLPGRIDAKIQRSMRDVWQTDCGALIASLLRTRWCVSLFEGSGAQETLKALEARSPGGAGGQESSATPHSSLGADISTVISNLKKEWSGSSLKSSGLAGSFRKPEQLSVRLDYLAAVEVLVDLTYLIGEALVQFHRISDGLGDYGMIRVATWLHPFLEALGEKVLRLKGILENLNRSVEEHIILASARGYAVEKPAPSQRMSQRAHVAIGRSVTNSSSHVQQLLQAVQDLRERSSPDRLPQVVAGIGDACMQLDAVLSSPEFRACVGDRFPSLPRIADVALGQTRDQAALKLDSPLQLTDGDACDTMSSLRTTAVPPCDQLKPDSLEPSTIRFDALDDDGNGDLAGRSSSKYLADKAKWPLHVERNASQHQDDLQGLQAKVVRLVPAYCGAGYVRHDTRGLRLEKGRLDVFEKSSMAKVKTSLNVKNDVEDVLHCSKRLSLNIRRLPQGADIVSGVRQSKSYVFEFESVDAAREFHSRISLQMRA